MKLLEKTSLLASLHDDGRARLPLLVAVVAGGALALRVGLPFWSPVFAPQSVSETQTEAENGARELQPDLALSQSLALLRSLALFDASASPQPTSAALPALNTALDLRLEGVMLAGDGANHQAVILGSERRGSYRVGDSLPGAANVKVEGIARDHVIIDNRGQREVLWLYANGQAHSVASGAAVASGGAIGGTAAGIVPPPGTEQRVAKTAARLAEIISVAPEAVNGQLVGYRLTPGARLKEFVQLGFQTNDIVTAVDGIALNDVANLPKLYGLMDGATEVSFSLLRDGVPLHLKVTLDPATSAASP